MEDWDSLVAQEDEEYKKTQSMTDVTQSLSASVKRMFHSPADNGSESRKSAPLDPSFESIYEIARKQGMTLQEFVRQDPDEAIRIAENTFAEWQNILNMAALEGAVMTTDANGEQQVFAINKNQVKMIELRYHSAERQLDKVNELAYTAYKDGEQRKDHLIRAMYNRAVHKGDTRAAIYLIDRVDGRPAETKTADIDYDNAYNIYAILHTLFDKQLQVVNSGNGIKLVCCSRRAGKTHFLVAILLLECLRRPNTMCMYIGETAELSEGLINTAANKIIDTAQLKDKRGRRLNWKKLDNGSQIMVRGLSNTKDPDQIRGHAAKVIVIDEFFHLKSELLEYLQREVLEPMQMDYADDYKFICAGTPPKVKGTFGQYAWENWEVEHFSWTWRDNPHPVDLEARKEYIDDILKGKGLDWTSSFARREYNGEWAYDDDLLLYPDVHSYDPREATPTLKVTRVLFGIDYGVGDNDTLIGIAWSDDEKRGYVFWEDKFNRLDIVDRTISQLEYLGQQVISAWMTALEFFKDMPLREANKRILWDADDNDQHLTDYMNINLRLSIPGGLFNWSEEEVSALRLNIQNAHKTDKVIMMDKIRDLLRTAGLLLIKGGKTEHECMSTILRRGPNGEVYNDVDNKAYHPDLLPAMRYALWNVIGI